MSTKYSKIMVESGFKKKLISILARFPSSVVAKNALLTIQKI
jgi:hypothetical protein